MGDGRDFSVVGDSDIAVIGMAGQFPGADDVDALWDNLLAGHHSVQALGPDYLPLPVQQPDSAGLREAWDELTRFRRR